LRVSAAGAAEFRKFIEHRRPGGGLSLRRTGAIATNRAYTMQGDTAKAKPAKAKPAYQDFLALWKDADSKFPVLIAAKMEYAKLQ
jgi:hypothetical protein